MTATFWAIIGVGLLLAYTIWIAAKEITVRLDIIQALLAAELKEGDGRRSSQDYKRGAMLGISAMMAPWDGFFVSVL